MRVRMVGIILFLCVFLPLGCLSKEQREAAKTPRAPEVSAWRADKTFLTVKKVEEIPGLVGIGRVIIKRSTDPNVYFSVAVIPLQEIPIGTEVKINSISWENSPAMVISSEFLVVRLE